MDLHNDYEKKEARMFKYGRVSGDHFAENVSQVFSLGRFYFESLAFGSVHVWDLGLPSALKLIVEVLGEAGEEIFEVEGPSTASFVFSPTLPFAAV
jgi:hypothetical protein